MKIVKKAEISPDHLLVRYMGESLWVAAAAWAGPSSHVLYATNQEDVRLGVFTQSPFIVGECKNSEWEAEKKIRDYLRNENSTIPVRDTPEVNESGR